jgi:hypothetical protein
MESSSSPAAEKLPAVVPRKTTNSRDRSATHAEQEGHCHTAKIILRWARERRVQRLRSDRTVGAPERDLLTQWIAILDGMEIKSAEQIFSVLDIARAAADRASDWRNWSFLTLQIQLAVERERMHTHQQLPTSAYTANLESRSMRILTLNGHRSK